MIHLGYFAIDTDAALAYDNFIRENRLDRRLNFPDPEPENLIPNTRLIRLTKGEWAIVDNEDFEKVNQYHWHVAENSTNKYALRSVLLNGKYYQQPMHCFILNIDSIIDHKNRNGLHNYKSNLRAASYAQNTFNKQKCKNKSSVYKGVIWRKRHKQFTSQITFNGSQMHLGYFRNEIDAALMYDARAKEFFGEFACLNFPK